MAFTVEDGTGIAGANSYVMLAYANAYHSDRGNAGWVGNDTAKQAALVKATDYLSQTYDDLWIGYLLTDTQGLAWPRAGLYGMSYTIVPDAVKHAVCILALEALKTELNPALNRGGKIKSKKIDIIETVYADDAPAGTTRPAIEGLLKRLVNSGKSILARAERI